MKGAFDPRGPYSVGVRSGWPSTGAAATARSGTRSGTDGSWPPSASVLARERGHRRQSTFLCEHLASHGYVVGAAEHTDNTAADFAARSPRTAAGEVLTEPERDKFLRRIVADRVPDLRFVCDELLGGPASEIIDRRRIGLLGRSFGGWAVLSTLETDDRFSAGARPRKSGCSSSAARTHFADQIDDEVACTREHAHLFPRVLGLAHLDASLKGSSEAERFLAREAIGELRARSVDAAEQEPGGPDRGRHPDMCT